MKKGHKFERGQGEGYGRVWVEEREGGNYEIIISKDKRSSNNKEKQNRGKIKTCKDVDQH